MKFATCLNCMDGRVQLPVISWIKNNYKVDFVDMITEAGMNGFLADSNNDISDILKKTDVSLARAGSMNIIFIVGHHNCLGNPVEEKKHKEQVNIAVEKIKTSKPKANVIGLWVSDEWKVEKII
ncbi:MAG: hypothetical protein L6420_02155 [Elusimicrobia bacterium]|nr:hypothetical protein [Elusimicrobiota bacterium]